MSSPTQTILAIDPGPEESAWVLMRGMEVESHGFFHNHRLLVMVIDRDDFLVIEDIRCYGMAVGQETFDTCKWMGRFQQANGGQAEYLPRLTVKMQLCKTTNAKDANVRQALIDRYGGSRERAVGTKKKPGPLYGVKNHVWSALAVGVAWLEIQAAR